MDQLISLLDLFGVTPDKYPFLVLGILMVIGVVYIRLSIGRKLGKIKDNVLVVITHLSSTASSWGRLNTDLIQVMSPMVLTELGLETLKESGFLEMMNDAYHRAEVMSVVHEKNPKTKLDVESHSIVSFAILLERECMKPVKTYLYNKPNIRDSYPTLAGIYIRDEYLKDHPEITQ